MRSNASEDFASVGTGYVTHTPPTEKQIKAAAAISNILGVPLPNELSFNAYYVFISENIDAAQEAVTFKKYWNEIIKSIKEEMNMKWF